MLAQDLPFGGNDQPIRINPEADRTVRKRRRNALAVALGANQTGGRDTLALLDKSVKSRWHRHQRGLLLSPAAARKKKEVSHVLTQP